MASTNLGVLGSTKGTDLQAIIDAIAEGMLDASIEIVISNRKKSFILERARNHGIEAVFISHKGEKREQFDREMAKLLEAKGVQLILLIGFMRILSPWFCHHWNKCRWWSVDGVVGQQRCYRRHFGLDSR